MTNFQPINTTGKPVIECFMGLELNRVGAIGYHVSCAGHCSRVHLGDSTFFLCDVADVCSSYGVDGCYILADGLSVCCCNGDRCNDKDQRIRPHVTRDLTCLIGYSIGDNFTRGGIMPCNGMCGRFETSLGTKMAVAYVCLDYDLCMGMNLYEECRNLRVNQQK
uniref:Uncharacterized protein n=1 Tax=Panagrolaimus sp. JU765 TaxID=591449 RepID=A0AC34RDQ1_9BILA